MHSLVLRIRGLLEASWALSPTMVGLACVTLDLAALLHLRIKAAQPATIQIVRQRSPAGNAVLMTITPKSKQSSCALILFAAVIFLTSAYLPAQDVPTFSSDVKVVSVLTSVRDKHGQIVENLTKDDFKLQQDGQPQTIRYFTKVTDMPLTLGLLVDTSASQRRLLEQERIASYSFLNNLMRPDDKDKAFVIHFDWEVELLQDLTSSRPKLEAALEKLDSPQFAPSSGGGGGGGYPGGGGGGGRGGGGGHHGGGTDLYDAVFLASDEVARRIQGRKALIILSDGVDTGSKVSLDRAIETAQRSNTLVYSILYADPDAYGRQVYPGMGGGGHHGGWGGGGMGRPGGGY